MRTMILAAVLMVFGCGDECDPVDPPECSTEGLLQCSPSGKEIQECQSGQWENIVHCGGVFVCMDDGVCR